MNPDMLAEAPITLNHTWGYKAADQDWKSAEEVLRIAYAQQQRGADIVKIVTAANSEAEEMENLRITTLLKKELKVPFLFLSGGTHNRFHRMIGPALGCVMGLCVQEYDARSSKDQPLLRAARQVLNHFDYMPKERLGI